MHYAKIPTSVKPLTAVPRQIPSLLCFQITEDSIPAMREISGNTHHGSAGITVDAEGKRYIHVYGDEWEIGSWMVLSSGLWANRSNADFEKSFCILEA